MLNNIFTVKKRVFHIDDECYIIYLGSDPEDYKPFLRIGNSKRLTKEIISNIFNIVITESYTGNPILEPDNLNKDDIHGNRYVGDKVVVDRFLKFLGNYNVEIEKINHFTDIKTDNKRAVVYFYNNGNIELFYNKELLFNLKRREKVDIHFIERTNFIKKNLLDDPFYYSDNTFAKPGFVIVHNNVLLYDLKHIIAINLPEKYFESLSQYGIDPDLISIVATENVSESLIELFKRKRYIKEEIKVLTNRTQHLKNAIDLFRINKNNSLNGDIINLNKTNAVNISGFSIKKSEEDKLSYIISSNKLTYQIKISDSIEKANNNIFINPILEIVKIPQMDNEKVLKIANGIPYNFISESISEDKMKKTYFKETIPFFEDFLNVEESALIKHLSKLISDHSNIAQLEKSIKIIKKNLKAIKPYHNNKVIFLLINAREIINNLINKDNFNKIIKDDLLTLIKNIDKTLKTTGKIENHLSLIGDIYLNDKHPVILYRLSKDTISSEELKLSKDIQNSIAKKSFLMNKLYNEEIKGLLSLIDKLKEYSLIPQEQKEKTLKDYKGESKEGIEEIAKKKTADVTKVKKIKKERHISKKPLIFTSLAIIIIAIIFTFLAIFIPKKSPFTSRQAKKISIQKEGLKTENETKEESSVEQIPEVQKKRLESYLSLGYIKITILDVYKLTNKIAVTNGYNKLDSVNQLGKDPNWIYPGNVITLPDQVKYTVIKGDTIWYIAKIFINKNLEKDWEIYLNILKEIDKNKNLINDRKEEIISRLESLKKNPYSENFIKEINKTIDRLANM